ncbi:flavodoxin [Bifidobacterium choloepi]|uniref:Flavodoxin n=1 Tax=Bifidobacterium choloepi TaxID=2614131 RepID=A0A6I5MX69_9BIFI|nr:flavodoxin [Bifidobacterium choloepi]NEG69158.1 flavodoxin [Bifidobacterium choloepi]
MDDMSDVLVAYYSASGNTARVARAIADRMSGDLFEIVPDPQYTAADLDYRDPSSRVCREHDDPSMRHVSLLDSAPEHFARYSLVFVGYPIWWGVAAWPVNTFVTMNDFSGKTVVPFATSASSPLALSAEKLSGETTTGAWEPGHRFQSLATDAEVRDWLQSLDV